jgi:hypothetical protein
MKSICLLSAIITLTVNVFAQAPAKNIYSGGMLILQPGYAITTSKHQELSNLGFGIGGILRFYFLDNFTAGIFGGSQKTRYNSANSGSSYLNLGYGGPFLGLSRKFGKFRYTASVFAGKGSIKNLHIENQSGNILTEAYLYKYPVWVFSPILSMDYALTQRLMLTFQTVCLTARYDENKSFYNPTIQLGILFNR